MHMFATCMKCLQESGRPNFILAPVPFYDDRVAFFDCAAGHKNALVLQAQKFEVLMESGANALLAGFTLEACASFSTALERCYEFGMKVLMLQLKVSEPVYERMFKEMARQSERQIGAFMALYTVEFGEPFKPHSDVVPFRNAVIHKGQIPTQDEAEKFCGEVYAIVLQLTGRLLSRLPDAIQKAVTLDLAKRHTALPEGVFPATSGGSAFFSLAKKDNAVTFQEAMSSLRIAKAMASAPMAGPSL